MCKTQIMGNVYSPRNQWPNAMLFSELDFQQGKVNHDLSGKHGVNTKEVPVFPAM